MTAKNTLIIGAIGESPFAEMCGDVNIPYCQNSSYGQGCSYFPNSYTPDNQRNTLKLEYDSFSKNVIKSVREQDSKIPMISVLFSGRPMLVEDILSESDTFIDAFLPGTSGGQGVIDAIVGDYTLRPDGDSDRTNTLSFDWPRSMVIIYFYIRMT
jgi:beta-glucosidase